MKRIVFVLGAGASQAAGVPVMADFFETATALDRQKPGLMRDAFTLVAKGRDALQQAQSKARFDLRNLESVFAAFEMAELLFDDLGALTGDEIHGLSHAMRQVIVHTVEQSMSVQLDQGSIRPPAGYHVFGPLIASLMDAGHDVSIITFNYDIGTELGLLSADVQPQYCIEGAPITRSGPGKVIELFKLHGSVNWGRCPRCHAVIVQQVHDVVRDLERVLRKQGTLPGVRIVTLNASAAVGSLVCLNGSCSGARCDGDPVIVPPTAYKMDSHQALRTVWRGAARRLREAEEIFILGYSWPETDQFFHQLYALGSLGGSILSRLWVGNPDETVSERFKSQLLGQQALACYGPPPQIFGDGLKFANILTPIARALGVNEISPSSIPVLAEHRQRK